MVYPQYPLAGIPSYQDSAAPSIDFPVGFPRASASAAGGVPYGYNPLFPMPSMFSMPMDMSLPLHPYHMITNGNQNLFPRCSSSEQPQLQASRSGTVSQAPRRFRSSDSKTLAPHNAGRVMKRSSVKTSSNLKDSKANSTVIKIATSSIAKYPLRADQKIGTGVTPKNGVPIVISTATRKAIPESILQTSKKEAASTNVIIIDDSEDQNKGQVKDNKTNLRMGTINITATATPHDITSDQFRKLFSTQHWETFHKISVISLVEIMAGKNGDEYTSWLRRLARHIGHRETYGIYEVDGFLYEFDKSTSEALPIDQREYDGHHVRLHHKCSRPEAMPQPMEVNGGILSDSNDSFLNFLDKDDGMLLSDSRTEMTAGELLDSLEEEYSSSFPVDIEESMRY